MGWKGTVRSVSAAMRAAERESQRHHKQMMKEQMIDDAADAVESWQDYIHDLVSIHANPADDVDWTAIAHKAEPVKPQKLSQKQNFAERALSEFTPKFWHFLVGGSDRKRDRLEEALHKAIQDDEMTYQASISSYDSKKAEWEADRSLANRLLAGDLSAKKEVIAEMQSLSSESLIGSAVSFELDEEHVHAIPVVHTDEVVPNYRRKQLQSGRLSESKMPAGQFNELYQDYVCSVALRVAGDLFGLLPDNEVFVTCVATKLNKTTGHQEPTPILSVHFVKETFARLNLSNLDPSDSLANFNHVMNFKRTKGFERIEPLKSIEGTN